jgi:hypothetical protein
MGILSVIDHKFDNDKVVSTINHAVRGLKLKETGVRDGKSPAHIFCTLYIYNCA